jgi:hypothetical protein
VVQLNLIEEQVFNGRGVSPHGLTNFPGAEVISVTPLKLDRGFPAVLFDYFFVTRVEETLPAYVETLDVISDVHQLLRGESLPDSGVERLIDFPAIDKRRFSTLLSGLETQEPDFHGPSVQV